MKKLFKNLPAVVFVVIGLLCVAFAAQIPFYTSISGQLELLLGGLYADASGVIGLAAKGRFLAQHATEIEIAARCLFGLLVGGLAVLICRHWVSLSIFGLLAAGLVYYH